MDDLLKNVISFLLEPESALSEVFLGIFIIIFLVGVTYIFLGIKRCRLSKEKIISDYEQNKYKYEIQSYVEMIVQKACIRDEKIMDLPNLFVSVGILGTFIGLGVAIQSAAQLLSTDKVDIARLNTVLEIIAFKFQTSVWGTCFSIVYQKFLAEPYFEYKQKINDNIVEVILNSETENKKTLLEKQITKLEYIKADLTECSKYGSEFVEIFEQFKVRVNELNSMVANFNERMLTVIDENERSFEAKQFEIAAMHKEMLLSINENIEGVKEAFVNEQEYVAEKHDEMLVKIHRSVDTLQKVFLRSENEYVKDTQEAFSKILRESLEKIHNEYIMEAHNLGKVISKFDGVLNGVQSEVDIIHKEFTDEQEKFTKANIESYRQIKETMEYLVNMENNHKEKMVVIYKDMKDVLDNFDKMSNVNADELRKFLESNTQNINDVGKQIVSSNIAAHKDLMDMLGEIRSSVENSNSIDSVKALEKSMLLQSKENLNAISTLVDSNKEVLSASNKNFEVLNSNVLDVNNKIMQKLVCTIENIESGNKTQKQYLELIKDKITEHSNVANTTFEAWKVLVETLVEKQNDSLHKIIEVTNNGLVINADKMDIVHNLLRDISENEVKIQQLLLQSIEVAQNNKITDIEMKIQELVLDGNDDKYSSKDIE